MTADRVVCLTIDGQELRVPAGCTVLEAATAAGIHIPTFCHHEKLVPVGACRMCLVEIEGARGLQTSCSTPVREGMVVKVHTSPEAVAARKANLEFLLTNHPLDCPVCDKGGECILQDQALQDGPGMSRYIEEKRHKNKRFPLSEFILIDQERCVLCWRCIRFLDEWADDHELDLFGRGANTRIQTFPGRTLTSKWQGNTIDVCPVGALTSRVFRFEARIWELTDTPSVCTLCPVGCNTTLGVKNNTLRRITPRENPDVNDVWICDKGRFAHGYVDHPDRLTTPLIRRDGELRPATWDEALDLIASRLREIIASDGPQAVAALGSSRATNEANYLLQRLMRSVVETNSVDYGDRMPQAAPLLRDLSSLEHKDVVLLLGFDPSVAAPMVELWIKKGVLRHGAQVIVANPRKIELGRYGGPWLAYRPGGEAALVHGLAQVIVSKGWQSSTSRVTNADEYRAWLGGYQPGAVEQRTGVGAEALTRAAELLAKAAHPVVLCGPDWLAGSAGRANLDVLQNLALLLANAEVAFVPENANTVGALEMGMAPDLVPGKQPFSDIKARSRLSSFWGGKLSPVDGLDMAGMIAAAHAGRLKALWVMGSDPATSSRQADLALGAIPFLIVQDLFLTDTALQAEVVLPAASFAEVEGTYTNLTGRIQAVHPALRSPGEAKPDWWILAQAGRRMARLMGEGKQAKLWDFEGAGGVLAEISRVIPAFRDLNRATLSSQGWQREDAPPANRRSFALVAPDAPAADPDYPLVLVAGNLFYDKGTLLSRAERIPNVVPEAFVAVNPADAARLGLADGDQGTVVSREGRLGVAVRVTEDVAPGVAWMPRNLGAAPLSTLLSDGRAWTPVTIVK